MPNHKDDTPGRGEPPRRQRLKSALRENLKRRKLQARQRAAMPAASPAEDGSADDHRMPPQDADSSADPEPPGRTALQNE